MFIKIQILIVPNINQHSLIKGNFQFFINYIKNISKKQRNNWD
jgi:hypothetical protein